MFNWADSSASFDGSGTIDKINDGVVEIGGSLVDFLRTTSVVCALICIMIIGISIGFRHSPQGIQENKAWFFDICIAVIGLSATASLVTFVVSVCL